MFCNRFVAGTFALCVAFVLHGLCGRREPLERGGFVEVCAKVELGRASQRLPARGARV